MKRAHLAAAGVLALMALGAGAPPAAADDLSPELSYALAAVPGGEVVDAGTAYWPDLGMTLTVPSPDATSRSSRIAGAIGSCPNGSVCAFKGSGLTGARLSWTTCTTHSTAALGSPPRSIADARSTGYLQARNGTTVVATAFAQSWNNVTSTSTNIRCVL
jgi:hypothetical protein